MVEAEAVIPGKRVLDGVAALVDVLTNLVVIRPDHVGPEEEKTQIQSDSVTVCNFKSGNAKAKHLAS